MLFLVIGQIFPNLNCHFHRRVRAAGFDVVKMYVLQSYCSCTFCKRKTRGETQFLIELATPYRLANQFRRHIALHYFLNTGFFFAMARIEFGINVCCYQPCSLKGHEQPPFGVIRPACRRKMPNVSTSNWTILFSSAFTVCFAFVFFFGILFYTNTVTICISKSVFNLIAL